jgi:hypothetical protein
MDRVFFTVDSLKIGFSVIYASEPALAGFSELLQQSGILALEIRI